MTSVRLPVHVRLELAEDRLDDPDLPELVAAAVGQASSRAVDRARGVHLVAACRAGDRLQPSVSIRFRGDPLPERLTADLSAGIRANAAIAAARLSARPLTSTPLTAPRDASGTGEPLDELRLVADRWDPDGDTYLVASYDDRGRPVPMRLHGRRRPAPGPPVSRLRLRNFASDTDLWAAVLLQFRGSPPPRLAVVVSDRHGRPVAGIMALGPAGGLPSVTWLGLVQEWLPAVGAGPARAVYRIGYQADTLRFLRSAADPPARERVRAQLLLELLRKESAGYPGLDDDYLSRMALARARQIPSPAGSSQYFELLTRGQRTQVFEIFSETLPEDTLPVVVFTEQVPIDPTAANPAYGQGCPPLETSSLPGWASTFGLLNPTPGIRDEAFLSEPPIESWPPAIAAQLSAAVKDIANQLHMTPGRFVGSFLISAMAHIDAQCRRLGRSGSGSRLAQLRNMAGAFGAVARLVELYPRVMASFDEAEALPCPLSRRSPTWLLHFFETFGSARVDAVGSMFVAACQDVLLGVLESSEREISRRMINFRAYMTVTRLLLLIMLTETVELTDLRDTLIERERVGFLESQVPSLSWLTDAAWATASQAVLGVYVSERVRPITPSRGTVSLRDGAYRVLDANGRWWSRAELDSVISTGRKQAFGVDPLLEKVADLPDLVHRLQDAQRRDNAASVTAGAVVTAAIDDEFRQLLTDLQKENHTRIRQVRADRTVAFGLATFQEAEVTTSTDIGATLSGIHALADNRLRPLFSDQDAYAEGMRQLAFQEIGRAELMEFFNFVGIAVIAVFCPPAAFLIGAVQAVEGLEQAFEHQGIQRAMLGGDEIISKAQAEAEMWGAVISAALTFLPEVPGVVRGAVGGTTALVKGEAREASIAAARQVMRRVTAHLAEVTAEHFAKAFVREIATMYVLNLALSAAIGRLTTAVAREVEVTGHASMGDLPDLISQAIGGAAAPGAGP